MSNKIDNDNAGGSGTQPPPESAPPRSDIVNKTKAGAGKCKPAKKCKGAPKAKANGANGNAHTGEQAGATPNGAHTAVDDEVKVELTRLAALSELARARQLPASAHKLKVSIPILRKALKDYLKQPKNEGSPQEDPASLDPFEAAADLEKELAELAKLSPVQYGQVRMAAAKRLGVSVKFLDEDREQRQRKARGIQGGGAGHKPAADPETWSTPVDGEMAAVLDELSGLINRFLMLPQVAVTALALYMVVTYVVDALDLLPYILVKSPEPKCGKTTLLSLMQAGCRRAMVAGGSSAAALIRIVDRVQPTLLLDEADTWVKRDESMRMFLDCGYERGQPIWRCIGDSHEPTGFEGFVPKFIAGIKNQDPTIESRSIIINIERKPKALTKEKWRRRKSPKLFSDIASKLMRWGTDNQTALRERIEAERVDTEYLTDDRDANNWEPLLAIADMVGGGWPAKARAAAIELTQPDPTAATTTSHELLCDLREVIDAMTEEVRARGVLKSVTMVTALKALEDRPWNTFGEQRKGLDPSAFAQLLKPYKLKAAAHRIPGAGKAGKPEWGYLLTDLERVFASYLPPRGSTDTGEGEGDGCASGTDGGAEARAGSSGDEGIAL